MKMSEGTCDHFSAEDLDTALYDAAKVGHDKCVHILIKKGADVNKRSSEKYFDTPLMIAAETGNLDSLKYLISAGANVNSPGLYRGPALYRAVSQNHVHCVKFLIKAGADVNLNHRLTMLMGAVVRGNTKCAEILIAAGANVNSRNKDNATGIMLATRESQTECIELLVKAGADVNALGGYNFTALIWAARGTSLQAVDCVKILLRAGAFINKFDTVGRNALLNSMADRCKTWSNDDAAMLLYAAGEILEGEIAGIKVDASDVMIPEFLQHKELSLKHMCREAIRKQLLLLAPHTHLFGRILQLGLPQVLSKYLLYCFSLDGNF